MKEMSPAALKRVYGYSFAKIYPLYVTKVERKGRTKEDLDAVIKWLTGWSGKKLETAIAKEIDLETFFKKAPKMNPKRKRITGVVCGVRVEEIKEKTMREIRYMDKLVDELAKGKALETILRK